MPYTVDFTAHIHRRQRRLWQLFGFLVLLLIMGVAAAIGWVYREWSRPTLAQQMALYQNFSQRLENLHETWMETDTAFKAIAPWYHLHWSDSVTNLVPTLLMAPQRLPRNLRPTRWELRTGGECLLTYELIFREDGKREQRAFAQESLETLFAPWSPTVSYPVGDLGPLQRLTFTVRFDLPAAPYRAVPPPPASLRRAVSDMDRRRQTLRGYSLATKREPGAGTLGTRVQTAVERSIPLLRDAPSPDPDRSWRDYAQRSMDPGTLMGQLRSALEQAGLPQIPSEISVVQEAWLDIGERRWPWRRIAALDSAELQAELLTLEALFNANLPARRIFQDQLERISEQRAPLLRGFNEAEIFDERLGDQRLITHLRDLGDEAPRVLIDRRPIADGLMFALWRVQLGAGPAERWLNRVAQIPVLPFGFEIEKLSIAVNQSEEGTLTIQNLTAEGLLPVRVSSR